MTKELDRIMDKLIDHKSNGYTVEYSDGDNGGMIPKIIHTIYAPEKPGDTCSSIREFEKLVVKTLPEITAEVWNDLIKDEGKRSIKYLRNELGILDSYLLDKTIDNILE